MALSKKKRCLERFVRKNTGRKASTRQRVEGFIFEVSLPNMEETYQIRDDDETRTAMDDLDAFEQRLNSGNPRAPKLASKAVPQRVKPAMPVVRKKGSDYVGAAVKAKPSKADDEGFALDTSDKVSDMKAVSDLDRFDDGNISE